MSNSPRLATLGANACAASGLQVRQPSQARNPLVRSWRMLAAYSPGPALIPSLAERVVSGT